MRPHRLRPRCATFTRPGHHSRRGKQPGGARRPTPLSAAGPFGTSLRPAVDGFQGEARPKIRVSGASPQSSQHTPPPPTSTPVRYDGCSPDVDSEAPRHPVNSPEMAEEVLMYPRVPTGTQHQEAGASGDGTSSTEENSASLESLQRRGGQQPPRLQGGTKKLTGATSLPAAAIVLPGLGGCQRGGAPGNRRGAPEYEC